MDRHSPVLKQRIQAAAVADVDNSLPGDENIERLRDECDQDQEEGLRRHQDAGDERHHFTKLAAIPINHDEGVRCQQPVPQEQRAFLAAPPCRKFVDRRHRGIAVRGDIGEPEVAFHQAVNQQGGCGGDERPDAVDSSLRAEQQERAARQFSGDRSDHGINCETKRQKNRERAYVFHEYLSSGLSHLGLGFILGRAFGLDFGSMEHAVGSELPVGQRLGAVLEGIGQRLDSRVDHVQPQIVLRQREMHGPAVPNNGICRYIAADTNALLAGVLRQLADLGDGHVVGLGLADPADGEPRQRAQNHGNQQPELNVIVHGAVLSCFILQYNAARRRVLP